ncbi:uncharacterized protein LOC132169065 [Corylus avellana]|uniref:uncharacterized protein LOC132169064 n=1 Tax=Corylus avellana TaxID=13451 RepID=UPI00286AE8ED|nr:uncharacterized protein LOC132169064 [Corylus avellana]XP_059436135.1 uncharacterized protein LOC132169065 [Corylus avellana]
MEFRDLVVFNKALLAKRIWQLFQNPNSLAAWILKAKYYAHSSVLEAMVGKRPSFAWGSIILSQAVIRNVLVWRVGNVRDIRVWGDRWLPTPTTFAVQSPCCIIDKDAWIVDLINQSTKRWKLTLISNIFNKEEARAISNIPLSPLQPLDKLIWQSCNNLLPTKTNLFRRRVVPNKSCPICDIDEETIEHILWSCPSAKDVWGNGTTKIQKGDYVGRESMQIFEMLLDMCEITDVELFTVVAQKIWFCRNAVVHGEVFSHPNQVISEARESLGNFQRQNLQDAEGVELPQARQLIQWQPPPYNTIKFNWDAEVEKNADI